MTAAPDSHGAVVASIVTDRARVAIVRARREAGQ